jgi:SAM-dependent methyltransferase
MNLYQRLLGTPFVYDRIRPLIVGGIDMSPVYGRLEARPDDVILDIGCGTGAALQHIPSFSRYLGIDTDPVAIDAARRRHGSRKGVAFECRECRKEDLERLAPTLVILAGLLHHVSDADAISLLEMIRDAKSVRRAVSLEIVYLPGVEHWISNAIAFLDRGRFCRTRQGYLDLLKRAGVPLVSDTLLWSDPDSRRARYLLLTLIG